MMFKRFVDTIMVAALAGLIVIVLFGCASIGNLGDGKLEPATKTAIGVGATVAALASPENAAVIRALTSKLSGEQQAADRMLTDAELFTAAKRAGFAVSLTYRVDGAIVDAAAVSWTWNIGRTHNGADTVPPDSAFTEAAVAPAPPADDLEAKLEMLSEKIEEKAKED